MRTIGLDVGERRVGIAICDTAGILATPYSAIERNRLDLDISAISEIATKGTPKLPIIKKGLRGFPFI